jgi:STAS-like domain of unknown function (DUF4325)
MKLSKENIINLEDYRVSTAKVFTGRDRGFFVREQCKIDEIETNFDIVKVIIPSNIYSINPSFFEELFFNVVNKLGKEEFLKKFEFSNLGEYNFEKPLNEAIERILRTKTAIG